jgi:hypothetical protein
LLLVTAFEEGAFDAVFGYAFVSFAGYEDAEVVEGFGSV